MLFSPFHFRLGIFYSASGNFPPHPIPFFLFQLLFFFAFLLLRDILSSSQGMLTLQAAHPPNTVTLSPLHSSFFFPRMALPHLFFLPVLLPRPGSFSPRQKMPLNFSFCSLLSGSAFGCGVSMGPSPPLGPLLGSDRHRSWDDEPPWSWNGRFF